MIFACIAAGGTGSRMGLDIPKQFAKINGKPIIIYTLEKFLSVSEIDRIYIGCHKDWAQYLRDMIKEHIDGYDKTEVIDGGKDRNETIFGCARRISEQFGSSGHIFITHDGVRPFVTADIIRENIDACRKYGSVGTYVAATDTIAISSDGVSVDSVPERKTLYNAQTPQTFILDELMSAYESLDEKKRAMITDTCSVMTLNGRKIHIVSGDYRNIKITTISDLTAAKALAYRK